MVEKSPAELRTIGERLRWARRQAGLTQVQLAAKAGIGQSAISSLESGDSAWLRAPNLLSLAAVLGLDIAWLESGGNLPRATYNPADHQFTDLLHALTPDNRRRLLAVGKALLADQIAGPKPRPTVADPFPAAPKPVAVAKKPAKTPR